MALSSSILPEFDHEMSNTRKTLERVPTAEFDWAPHPKSMKMGPLANHWRKFPNGGALRSTPIPSTSLLRKDRKTKGRSPQSREELFGNV